MVKNKPDGNQVATVRFGTSTSLAGAFFNAFGDQSSTIKTLPEQLAEKLVEQIITGVYAPGQRLHEIKLSEQFGVSRGPVREALRLLEREGLVVMPSRRGASVAKLTEKHLLDIFPVRAALMGICAEDLARRHSEEIQAVLDDGTDKLFAASKSGNIAEYTVIVYQLSMYIAEACGNVIARTVLFSLGRQTLSLTRRVFQDNDARETWAHNWRRIVEEIRRGDPEASRIAVCKLLRDIQAAAIAALHELDQKQPAAASGSKSGARPRDLEVVARGH